MEGDVRGVPQSKVYCFAIQSNLGNIVFEYGCQIKQTSANKTAAFCQRRTNILGCCEEDMNITGRNDRHREKAHIFLGKFSKSKGAQ